MNGIKLSLERQSLEYAIIWASNEWFTLTEVRRVTFAIQRDACPLCYAINASSPAEREPLIRAPSAVNSVHVPVTEIDAFTSYSRL